MIFGHQLQSISYSCMISEHTPKYFNSPIPRDLSGDNPLLDYALHLIMRYILSSYQLKQSVGQLCRFVLKALVDNTNSYQMLYYLCSQTKNVPTKTTKIYSREKITLCDVQVLENLLLGWWSIACLLHDTIRFYGPAHWLDYYNMYAIMCTWYYTFISKMYFSHWKPPGVSERMWSVNLDASIAGEYHTLWGHSSRPSH
jgi:hypothetical protein